MIDTWLLKTKIKSSFEKFVKKSFYGKISANSLTINGLILGLISSVFIYLSGILIPMFFTIISAILMCFSFFFDALDGTIARFNTPTKFGGILDIFCDRMVELSILIGLISTNITLLVWPGIFSLSAIVLCITMFLVVGGSINTEELDEQKKVIYYRKGLMERSETFIFLFLMTVLYFDPWRLILMWVFAGLVFLTAILRLRDAHQLFKP